VTSGAARSSEPAESFCLATLGLRVEVSSNEVGILHRFADLYAPCSAKSPGVPDLVLAIDRAQNSDAYKMFADGALCCESADASEIAAWAAWRINRSAIDQARRNDLIVHAGAVAIAGRAVVVVGASGAGKSTLVAALAQQGAGYMGDDAVEARGHESAAWVVSNPKPIALDDNSRAALMNLAPGNPELNEARAVVAPTGIGKAIPVDAELEPALVVIADYQADRPTTAQGLTRGEVAELLAAQSFNFPDVGRPALQTVAAIARSAPGFRLQFDDLASACAVIEELLT
jgi:hypothetical protein